MEDESEVVGLILKLIDDTIAGYTTEFDYRRERLVELKKEMKFIDKSFRQLAPASAAQIGDTDDSFARNQQRIEIEDSDIMHKQYDAQCWEERKEHSTAEESTDVEEDRCEQDVFGGNRTHSSLYDNAGIDLLQAKLRCNQIISNCIARIDMMDKKIAEMENCLKLGKRRLQGLRMRMKTYTSMMRQGTRLPEVEAYLQQKQELRSSRDEVVLVNAEDEIVQEQREDEIRKFESPDKGDEEEGIDAEVESDARQCMIV